MSSARRRSADRRRSAGFSLLDAVGAAAFLSVSLLGLSMTTVSLTRNAKGADNASVATALAQQKLEQLRSMWLGAAALQSGTYTDAGNPLKPDGTAGSGRYNRSWVVSAKDTPRLGLKTVTVTVSWTDSRTHSTQVASYVRCSAIPCP